MPLKKYSKNKISISIDSNLLKAIDKIKKYPAWRDSRSAVIEAALQEYIKK